MIGLDKVINGDCLEVLKTLPDESIDCCVTSPPYYGLRDYGTGEWVGGDPNCPHYRTSKYSENTSTGHKTMMDTGHPVGDAIYKTVCPICGAVREDRQIGLEETPEKYIEKLTDVFHEVKRVLKNDGTLWLNIGDSYWGSGSRGWDFTDKFTEASEIQKGSKGTTDLHNLPKLVGNVNGYKNKDLIGIPWMLAFALRNDGWYLRQDIIWQKPNPMPESVTDRCTRSHEYIFLLTKKSHYYFDHEAIKEMSAVSEDDKRNKRDVWSVTIKPIKEAHFATFPEDLISPCILAGCRPNGVVLDPFFGSGTTGRVAVKYSRHFIGIELNPEYIEISDRRTENIQLDLMGLLERS